MPGVTDNSADIMSALFDPKPETAKPAAKAAAKAAPVIEADDDEEGFVGEEEETSDDDNSPAEGDEDFTDEEAGEDDDADEDDDDGEQTALDVNDDDLIEVMIDGKLELRPLSELKAALSSVGASQKRLKDATEVLKSIREERTTSQETLQKGQAAVFSVVQRLDQYLAGQKPQQPDEALRRTNPQQYLLLRDEAQQAERRINEARQNLSAMLQEANEEIVKGNDTFRAKEQKRLLERLPVFADPDKAPARRQLVTKQATEHYGYTEKELAVVADSRFFELLHDAAMYRHGKTAKSQPKTVKEAKETVAKAKKQRTLRSGTPSNAVLRARAEQQREQQRVTQAASSGKVKDIAATLLIPRK